MSIGSLFSVADLERIRAATVAAESSTGGEIVPYLVGQIDGYDVAHWRGAALFAMLAAVTAGLMYRHGGSWCGECLWWLPLPTLLGAGLGYASAFIAGVRRFLLTTADIDRQVHWRAEAAFLEEEVFNTQDRTGVLIFLALFERRAVIVADRGINKVVAPDVWQTLVDALVTGIRQGQATESLCQAIDACGKVLQEHKVRIRADDRDELRNGLRIREH